MKIIKIAILSENQPKNVLSCENCLGSVYITFWYNNIKPKHSKIIESIADIFKISVSL